MSINLDQVSTCINTTQECIKALQSTGLKIKDITKNINDLESNLNTLITAISNLSENIPKNESTKITIDLSKKCLNNASSFLETSLMKNKIKLYNWDLLSTKGKISNFVARLYNFFKGEYIYINSKFIISSKQCSEAATKLNTISQTVNLFGTSPPPNSETASPRVTPNRPPATPSILSPQTTTTLTPPSNQTTPIPQKETLLNITMKKWRDQFSTFSATNFQLSGENFSKNECICMPHINKEKNSYSITLSYPSTKTSLDFPIDFTSQPDKLLLKLSDKKTIDITNKTPQQVLTEIDSTGSFLSYPEYFARTVTSPITIETFTQYTSELRTATKTFVNLSYDNKEQKMFLHVYDPKTKSCLKYTCDYKTNPGSIIIKAPTGTTRTTNIVSPDNEQELYNLLLNTQNVSYTPAKDLEEPIRRRDEAVLSMQSFTGTLTREKVGKTNFLTTYIIDPISSLRGKNSFPFFMNTPLDESLLQLLASWTKSRLGCLYQLSDKSYKMSWSDRGGEVFDATVRINIDTENPSFDVTFGSKPKKFNSFDKVCEEFLGAPFNEALNLKQQLEKAIKEYLSPDSIKDERETIFNVVQKLSRQKNGQTVGCWYFDESDKSYKIVSYENGKIKANNIVSINFSTKPYILSITTSPNTTPQEFESVNDLNTALLGTAFQTALGDQDPKEIAAIPTN